MCNGLFRCPSSKLNFENYLGQPVCEDLRTTPGAGPHSWGSTASLNFLFGPRIQVLNGSSYTREPASLILMYRKQQRVQCCDVAREPEGPKPRKN